MALPARFELLPLMVVLLKVNGPSLQIPPPLWPDVLPLTVLFVSAVAGGSVSGSNWAIPPPPPSALLLSMVLSVTVNTPSLAMPPPPKAAEFPVTTTPSIPREAPLNTPPPDDADGRS
jgi:hypothetical protein